MEVKKQSGEARETTTKRLVKGTEVTGESAKRLKKKRKMEPFKS